MIKSNTVCMVKGIPEDRSAFNCNGKVVIVTGVKTVVDGDFIYKISPPLIDGKGTSMEGCAGKYLFPFDDDSLTGVVGINTPAPIIPESIAA